MVSRGAFGAAERGQKGAFLGDLSSRFTVGSCRAREGPSCKGNNQLNKVKVFFVKKTFRPSIIYTQ